MNTAPQQGTDVGRIGGRPATPEDVQETAGVATPSPASNERPLLSASLGSHTRTAEQQGTDNVDEWNSPPICGESSGRADRNFFHDSDYPPAFPEDRPRIVSVPRARQPWGNHDGRFYPVSNTDHQGLEWRYHVTTEVEEYRISTFEIDFTGCSVANEWTLELRTGYETYKACESLAKSLRYPLRNSIDRRAGYLFFQELTWRCWLRAGEKRLEVLRKWPSGFEEYGGTASHWYEIRNCFEKAEKVRQDTQRTVVTVQPASVDLSANFRADIVQETRDDLTAQADPGDNKHTINMVAIQILNDILTKMLIIPPTGANALPEWWTVAIDVAARVGKPVYALNPIQYEEMRTANMRLKADMERHLNDPTRDETIEDYPHTAYPYLPPLKADLANSYRPNINDADLGRKCTNTTFSMLGGFWSDCDNKGRRV